MSNHEKISYVEFPAKNIEASKAFFTDAFGWTFTDYGPNYASFSDQGLDGGFFTSDKAASTSSGSALVVLYSGTLEATQTKVEAAGGTILKPIFDFPGGRRFHFADPSGNELAVWSDKPASDSD
jgi:predicted enzyme related to lactoylglutathione lyase